MGQALARNGAVTMDTNTISNDATCAAVPAPTPTPTATPAATPTAAPTAAPRSTPTVTPNATPTATPTAAPLATPTATPSVVLPGTDTVGAPGESGFSPWPFVLIAVILGLVGWSARSRALRRR